MQDQDTNTKEKNAKHLAKLKTYSDETGKLIEYAMQRIDLLMISVSGASIYLCLEIMKYMHEQSITESTCPFKIIGLLFALSIVVNFLGQWAAYFSSYHMKCSTDCDVEWREYHAADPLRKPSTIDEHEQKSTRFSAWVARANFTSTGLMLIGLLALVLSVWIIF